MQIRKQQLELDIEQQTGSKLRKEYIKAVYCQPSYLTYMKSISCEMYWVELPGLYLSLIFFFLKLWKILKEMGIPDHLTCLLRNLYAGQEATN